MTYITALFNLALMMAVPERINQFGVKTDKYLEKAEN